MTKEEVLSKSRKENKNGDEMEKKVLNDATKFSYIAMVVFSAIFAFIRAEQGDPIMDLPAICCASVCANFLYRFIKTREKLNVIIAIITLISTIIFSILFFMGR